MISSLARTTALAAVALLAISPTAFGQSQSPERHTLEALRAAQAQHQRHIEDLRARIADVQHQYKGVTANDARDRLARQLAKLEVQLETQTTDQRDLRAQSALLAQSLDLAARQGKGKRSRAQDPLKSVDEDERALAKAEQDADRAAQELDRAMVQLHERHARTMQRLEKKLQQDRRAMERHKDVTQEELARAEERLERRVQRLEQDADAERAAAERNLERGLAALEEAKLGGEARARREQAVLEEHERAIKELAARRDRDRDDLEQEREHFHRSRELAMREVDDVLARAEQDLQQTRERADHDLHREMVLLQEQHARRQHDLERTRTELRDRHTRLLSRRDQQAVREHATRVMVGDPLHSAPPHAAAATQPVVLQMQQSVHELREEVRELRNLVRQLDKIVRRRPN